MSGGSNPRDVTGRFTIDQLWAVNQPQSGWDSSSSFFVSAMYWNELPAVTWRSAWVTSLNAGGAAGAAVGDANGD